MKTFTTTMEVDVIVTYEIEPAQKGRWDSMGVPEDPSWDAYPYEFELTFPTFAELPEADRDAIQIACEKDMEEE